MYDNQSFTTTTTTEPRVVSRTSAPEEKIRFFCSLFRGRDDVFARRFESRKTGRGGYAPACRNEWVRGICEKPRIKCAECRNRAFIPMAEEGRARSVYEPFHGGGAATGGDMYLNGRWKGFYALLRTWTSIWEQC